MWPRSEPILDARTLDGIIRKLMSIDDKVDTLIEELIGPDGEEEEDA